MADRGLGGPYSVLPVTPEESIGVKGVKEGRGKERGVRGTLTLVPSYSQMGMEETRFEIDRLSQGWALI
jgi:hypothetical protein